MEQKAKISIEFEDDGAPKITFEGKILSKHMMLLKLGLRKAYVKHLYKREEKKGVVNEQRKD